MLNMQEGINFDGACSIARTKIKEVGQYVLDMKQNIPETLYASSDKGEMIANITLAYRHLEDAAMRMGKAIQAFEGGKNIYDSNDAKRVAEAGPGERVGEGMEIPSKKQSHP